jgi:inorganic pyrophosphatase/exopolyphosphatase
MHDQTDVIGHVNPDTDSIAAAMGYVWLLRKRDGTRDAPGVVSRKKQLLPVVLGLLER